MHQRLAHLAPALALALVSLPGCGINVKNDPQSKSDDQVPAEIPSTPAAGKINGTDWVIGSAYTNPRSDSGDVSFKLSDETTASPCDPFATSHSETTREVMGSFSPEVGTHDFNATTHHLMTFSFRGSDGQYQNLIGGGRIIIDEVTDATIKGRIYFKFDDNSVIGAFEAKRCKAGSYKPEDELPVNGVDERIAGAWNSPQYILGSASDWTWTLTAKGAGLYGIQLKNEQGDLIEDADEQWRLDTATTPMRLFRQVTASRKSLNSLKRVGDKQYCIYMLDGEGASRKMAVTCDYSRFPSTVTDYNQKELYTPVAP